MNNIPFKKLLYAIKETYTESSSKNHQKNIRKKNAEELPTYYVIEDLMKWAGYPPVIQEREIFRFDELKPALDLFKKYRPQDYNKEHLVSKEGLEYARLTLGAKIGNIEVDIIHVRNDKNYLVLDFNKIDDFKTNEYFIESLIEINKEIGIDRINIYRMPSEEEIKAAEEANLPIKLIKEELEMSEWPNSYFEPEEQEKKYFLDGNLRLVEYLNPIDTIILKSGEIVCLNTVQPLVESVKFTGLTQKNMEVSFEYQDISKVVKNRQEIVPKTLEKQIFETKETIQNIEDTLNDLINGPQNAFTESDIEYETALLKKLKKIIDVLEEYKRNPERMHSINQNLTESDMKYVKRLSEKLYVLTNGTLNSGFNAYYDNVKKEIEEKGYGPVVGVMKDKLNVKGIENVPLMEFEINEG